MSSARLHRVVPALLITAGWLGAMDATSTAHPPGSAPTVTCNNGGTIHCQHGPCPPVITGGPTGVSCHLGGSSIDMLSGTYLHDADVYRVGGPDAGGCASCGAAGSAPRQPGLPGLLLRRYYLSRVALLHGSLGYDHFLSTDTYLRFDWGTSDGTGSSVRYVDPADGTTKQGFQEQFGSDHANDGILHDAVGQFRDLRLYAADGTPTASASAAATAVVTDIDGGRRVFELIDAGEGARVRYGRLLRIVDHAGVAVQGIAYRYAADATPAALGNDRVRLWQVATVTAADATRASYTYDTVKRAGRYPVTAIALPSGATTTFRYSGNDLVANDLPGLGTATFVRTYDTTLQKIATAIDDPAAGPGHQRKTVWWSATWYQLGDGTWIPQTEGQTRRLDNGAGEPMYAAWSDPTVVDSASTTYVWSGDRGLERFEVTAAAAQVRAYARAPEFVLGQDPSLATYTERRVFSNDTTRELVPGQTDTLGRTRQFTYDGTTRRVLSTTDEAGSTVRATYNERGQPLSETDALGRVTTHAYDAAGNRVSRTTGAGAEASTWRWEYDARGLVTAEIDANGNRTDHAYDAAGHLASITEPADVAGGARPVRGRCAASPMMRRAG